MPKTIETLRRPAFKEDVLHSHIAETYFHQRIQTKVHKKKQSHRLNIDFPRLFITAAIIAVLSLLISISATFVYKRYISILQKKTAELKVINIVSQNSVNKTIIRKFEFRGHAKRGSSADIKDSIILNNTRKYGWADLSIDFKFPIDVSERMLLLSLRGTTGGEKINIVLRDTKNRSSRLSDISLSSDTAEKTIHMGELRKDIDLSSIDHIRLEYGHVGESVKQMDSPINVTIYVSNISLAKER